MKALKVEFECPACGGILKKIYPAETLNHLKRNLGIEIRCGCGMKSGFRILNFSLANLVLEESKIKDKK